MHMPLERGRISVFGIGGDNNISMLDSEEDEGLKMQLKYDVWNYPDTSFAVRPESFNPYLYSVMAKIED